MGGWETYPVFVFDVFTDREADLHSPIVAAFEGVVEGAVYVHAHLGLLGDVPERNTGGLYRYIEVGGWVEEEKVV